MTEAMTTPTPAQDAQPVAFLLEYTDPHDGTRGRTVWMNRPKDYELMPGDTVTPLYASPPTQALAKANQSSKYLRNYTGMLGAVATRLHNDIDAALALLPQPAVVEVSLPEPKFDGYCPPEHGNAAEYWEEGFREGFDAALAAVSKAMGVEVKGKANG